MFSHEYLRKIQVIECVCLSRVQARGQATGWEVYAIVCLRVEESLII